MALIAMLMIIALSMNVIVFELCDVLIATRGSYSYLWGIRNIINQFWELFILIVAYH